VSDRCPLYPQKQTFVAVTGMSALCQKRTPALQQFTSAAKHWAAVGACGYVAQWQGEPFHEIFRERCALTVLLPIYNFQMDRSDAIRLLTALVAAGMNIHAPRANAWIEKKALQIGLEGNQFASALAYAGNESWLADAPRQG
jgi:hypothetical protein